MVFSEPNPHFHSGPEGDDDLSGPVECWCGALLSDEDMEEMYRHLPSRCGGYGVLDCHCGGDQCVCHNHGEVECDGCPDCQEDDYDDDVMDLDYDDELDG